MMKTLSMLLVAITAQPQQTQTPAQTPAQPEAIPALIKTTQAAAPQAPPQATRPLLPANQHYGSYGQICNYANQPLHEVVCGAAGQAGIEQYPGFMKCERGYDCCLCGTVTCGNQYEGCNTFSAGDAGVMGVENVKIIGDQQGAELLFIGIEAGAGSKVTGTNIKSVFAAGQAALYKAEITAEVIEDFRLDCSGYRACEDAVIVIKISGPPAGYRCNPEYPFQMKQLADISCSGKLSCLNTKFIVINEGCSEIEIQQIECVLGDSCQGTTFEIVQTNANILTNSCNIPNAQMNSMGLNSLCNPGQAHAQQNNPQNNLYVPAVTV